MKKFTEKVGTTKKAMVEYLTNHFRYDTMNSWNCGTSYAHNMKLYTLGLTREQEDKAYDLIDFDEVGWYIEDCIADFEAECPGYTAGFNGRSGGYLVLYEMKLEPLDYKSYCPACGQRNFTTVEETGNRCGRCGQHTRINYIKPPMTKRVYPGRSIDQDEDFSSWYKADVADRVKVVQAFDRLADNLVAALVDMLENYTIEEEEYTVTQTRKVLVEAV